MGDVGGEPKLADEDTTDNGDVTAAVTFKGPANGDDGNDIFG
jgi:hypothetical protein